VTAGASHFLS